MAPGFRSWLHKWLPAIAERFGLSILAERLTKPLADQERAVALFRKFSRKLPDPYSEASLLNAERSPVPFRHRDDAKKELERWCYDDSSGWVLWKLVTGETGRGKTRLIMDLVETLNGETGRPWNAGFLDPVKLRRDPDALSGFDRLPGDLLFVIDYAERFEPEVRTVLKASLALGREEPPRRVRVVLISRRHSDLWREMAKDDTEIRDFMGKAGFSQFEPSPLGQEKATREAVFDHAYAAFAEHFAEERPLAERPNLNQKGFEEAILIHLAALSLYRREIPAREVSEEALLNWILDRERRQWNRLIEDRAEKQRLPAALAHAPVEQAAAYLTLVSLGGEGIRGPDEAVASLKKCPLLEGQPAATLLALAQIFHELYPGPAWINGVTPDLIGTYLLSVTQDSFIQHLYE